MSVTVNLSSAAQPPGTVSFEPAPLGVARLVRALRSAGELPGRGAAIVTSEQDNRVVPQRLLLDRGYGSSDILIHR
jgi:hypothetical protein